MSITDTDIINGVLKMVRDRDLSELKARYNTKRSNIAVLKAESTQLLEELRSKCDHSGTIYLTPMKENVFFCADSPRRMCSVCGVEEDTWKSSLHSVLPSEYNEAVKLRTVTIADRDTFYQQRF
jgi:hypothetical protein